EGEGEGEGEGEACSNAWFPVDVEGWTKTFALSGSEGNTGTRTESSTGLLSSHPESSTGEVYGLSIDLQTSAWSYTIVQSIGCDTHGEGVFFHDYAGDWSIMLYDIFEVTGTVETDLSPSRQLLPPEYAVGATGNWNYSYTSTFVTETEYGSGSSTVETSTMSYNGTYTETGFETITLATGDTVDAYVLTNEFTASGTPPIGFPIPAAGSIKQWFVKGLGLVRQVTSEDGTDETFTRELESYSGLTVIE
ncbi:MAG TPA: hypothetical protein DFR83_00805, partial [Deltaproteobacteria bacterium]|nr:hypothetical protein [Deltaproteobacteria bacterium]